MSNKLVTIFALHLDSFIVTQNFSSVYQYRNSGSGQILQPRQLNLSPGLAKIAPWCLARRDSLPAKVPGLKSAWLRHQRFLLIPAGRYKKCCVVVSIFGYPQTPTRNCRLLKSV
jgi:hypothetical protein